MKAQLKYSYIFGLFAFVIGLVFGSEIVIRILPTYTSTIQKRNLDLVADSIIYLLSKDQGYWENSTDHGTNWEIHLADTKRIGFMKAGSLAEAKIDASKEFSYPELKEKLGLAERNVFIKIICNTTSEACSAVNVTCIGMEPVGKDTGIREERVLVKNSNTINCMLRVVVW